MALGCVAVVEVGSQIPFTLLRLSFVLISGLYAPRGPATPSRLSVRAGHWLPLGETSAGGLPAKAELRG